MAKNCNPIDQVQLFLAGKMSLDAFEDWSASFVHSVYAVENKEHQELATRIRSVLNAFEDEEEDVLRKELAAAVDPFFQKSFLVGVRPEDVARIAPHLGSFAATVTLEGMEIPFGFRPGVSECDSSVYGLARIMSGVRATSTPSMLATT
jgi:hypothetical protein